jgi:hypothetical protein
LSARRDSRGAAERTASRAPKKRFMTETALYNLTGQAIPPKARITIVGEFKPGHQLIIEDDSGGVAAAYWRTAAEVQARLQASPPNENELTWPPKSKPRAAYS